METLELLEDLLLDYPGTLLLVSHDRTFLNNVVTSTLALEGQGRVGEYVGGYDDWVRQRRHEPLAPAPAGKPNNERQKRPSKPGLSFKEQRELELMPEAIETLEAEKEELYCSIAAPEFYRTKGPEAASALARLKSVEEQLEESYRRWEFLDMKACEALNLPARAK